MRSARVLQEIRDLRQETRDLVREIAAQRQDVRHLGVESRGVLEELREMRTEFRDVIRFNTEVIRRNEVAFHGMMGALQELREESRAHTRAIFALIDRLQGGSAPAG